jgi:hypothetical protein
MRYGLVVNPRRFPMGVRITITVREPVKKEIQKLAKKRDRPLSEMASMLIEKGLEMEGVNVK